MDAYRDDGYGSTFTFAERASVDAEADFIAKTYMHLAGAIVAFCGLTAAFVNAPGVEGVIASVFSSRFSGIIVIGAFMLVGWIAESWARSATSPTMQYLGLGLYVVAEAVIFTPMLYIAARFSDPNVIPTAGILTLTVFGGLSAVVLVTRKNFSFLAPALSIAGFAALGVVLCAAFIPGFSLGGNLGLWFSLAMVVLAGGYVLYYTSAVLHDYRIGQHVAAALALFSAIALLFWYILRIVMSFSSRD